MTEFFRTEQPWGLTSPDPAYARRKRQRDRLLPGARKAPAGAVGWGDESWFVRWSYAFRPWVHQDAPLHVAQRWAEPVDTTALYAALADECQEAFLQWTSTSPNSETTVAFLTVLMAQWAQTPKQFMVLFWDKASWYTSRRTRQWIRTYNRRAKRQQLPRLLGMLPSDPQSVADAPRTNFGASETSRPGRSPVCHRSCLASRGCPGIS